MVKVVVDDAPDVAPAETADPAAPEETPVVEKKGKMKVEDLALLMVQTFRAGRLNTDQEAVLAAIEVELGIRTDNCVHSKYDSYCDADNVFHCMNCGEVVPAPAAVLA